MNCKIVECSFQISASEAFVLGFSPGSGSLGPAGRRGGGQVFADMEKIDQIAALVSEDFATLEIDPRRAVAHAADATVESPAPPAWRIDPSGGPARRARRN